MGTEQRKVSRKHPRWAGGPGGGNSAYERAGDARRLA